MHQSTRATQELASCRKQCLVEPEKGSHSVAEECTAFLGLWSRHPQDLAESGNQAKTPVMGRATGTGGEGIMSPGHKATCGECGQWAPHRGSLCSEPHSSSCRVRCMPPSKSLGSLGRPGILADSASALGVGEVVGGGKATGTKGGGGTWWLPICPSTAQQLSAEEGGPGGSAGAASVGS